MFFIILAAVLPVIVLLIYILRKDSIQPEPPKYLIKAFVFGLLSVLFSFAFSIPLSRLLEINDNVATVTDSVITSFFSAAIPEELAKFILLYIFVRNNPYFDEKFDGIVYATCIGLGFACLENIMYLFSNIDTWLQTGIMRALFAVPAHFFFAVLMGYYFALYKFSNKDKVKNFILALLMPILAHGIYDTIAFASDLNTGFSTIIFIGFVWFCNFLRKLAQDKISHLFGK
ncbi:MAG: PrsW family intramembrane metalloprotease [Bacteroidales bacterium]|nr:PrsW family intramembrane metalloprotease [Bacteroidales bacterium]